MTSKFNDEDVQLVPYNIIFIPLADNNVRSISKAKYTSVYILIKGKPYNLRPSKGVTIC